VIGSADRLRLAAHEAGHAIVADDLGYVVTRCAIDARTGAGVTQCAGAGRSVVALVAGEAGEALAGFTPGFRPDHPGSDGTRLLAYAPDAIDSARTFATAILTRRREEWAALTARLVADGEARMIDLSAAGRASPLAADYLLQQLRAMAGPVADVLLPKSAT